MNNFIHLCPNCFADKQTAKQCPSCGFEETVSQQNPLYIKPRTLLNQRYLIGNVIGHGGFGITYLSWDLNLKRKVAIKEFLPTVLATRISETEGGSTRYTVMHTGNQEQAFQIGLKKFLKEARILAGFAHENIVRVIDYFEAYNTGYIVMEYVGLEDLSQLIKRQPQKRLEVVEALDIFFPILNALKVIHANGIYHQDISLPNIRMVDDNKPVLIDFGAARFIVGEISQSLDRIFKPGYSPLEQVTSSGKIGPWTDIYACGAMFYAMIMGELPPQSIDRLEQDDLIAPAQKKGVEISPSVNNAVLKALSVRIGDRFQTVAEFENALKKTGGGKKRWLAAAAGGGVFMVGAIAAVVLIDKNNQKTPPVGESESSSVETFSIRRHSEPPSVEPPPVGNSEPPSVEPPPVGNSERRAVEPPPVVRDLDLEPPSVVVKDIQQTYFEGNQGFYKIRVTDNNELANFSFKITDTGVIAQSSSLDGKKEYIHIGSFSTAGWIPERIYDYFVDVEDIAGNKTQKTGNFFLKLQPDRQPPSVEISINSVYQIGESISYSISLKDNKGLDDFTFRLKDTSIYKTGKLNGQKEYEYNGSFSTDDWKTGQYTYISTGEDKAGNTTTKTGSFLLEQAFQLFSDSGGLILKINVPAKAVLDGVTLPDGGQASKRTHYFSDLEPESHRLKIWASGYRTQSVWISIRPNEITNRSIELEYE
jgi:serine/threonine protein kinase